MKDIIAMFRRKENDISLKRSYNQLKGNMFYDLKMPIGYPKRTPFENYAYFVVAAASIKTVAAAIGFSEKNIVEKFKTGASRMCRGLMHSEGKAYYTMDEIKELGLTSPAHLALIIKG